MNNEVKKEIAAKAVDGEVVAHLLELVGEKTYGNETSIPKDSIVTFYSLGVNTIGNKEYVCVFGNTANKAVKVSLSQLVGPEDWAYFNEESAVNECLKNGKKVKKTLTPTGSKGSVARRWQSPSLIAAELIQILNERFGRGEVLQLKYEGYLVSSWTAQNDSTDTSFEEYRVGYKRAQKGHLWCEI